MKWLDLPDAVLPAMTAFASGLGGEGTETFAQLLLKDPILKDNPVVIIQVSPRVALALVCFCKEDLFAFCKEDFSWVSVYSGSSACTVREVKLGFLIRVCISVWLALSLSINSSRKLCP